MLRTKWLVLNLLGITIGLVLYCGLTLHGGWAISTEASAQASTKSESLKSEITKLIGELRDKSPEVQDKAVARLREIGVPALELLYRQENDPKVDVRGRVNDLIKAIRLDNHLPPRVDGLEFELNVDKTWPIPEPGEEAKIKLELVMTNVSNQPINVNFHNATTIALKNKAGKEWRGLGFGRPVDQKRTFATVPPSAAIKMIFPAKLLHLKDVKNQLMFWYVDGWTYGVAEYKGILAGTYQLSLVYENNQEMSKIDTSMRFWVGASGTLTETIVVK